MAYQKNIYQNIGNIFWIPKKYISDNYGFKVIFLWFFHCIISYANFVCFKNLS